MFGKTIKSALIDSGCDDEGVQGVEEEDENFGGKNSGDRTQDVYENDGGMGYNPSFDENQQQHFGNSSLIDGVENMGEASLETDENDLNDKGSDDDDGSPTKSSYLIPSSGHTQPTEDCMILCPGSGISNSKLIEYQPPLTAGDHSKIQVSSGVLSMNVSKKFGDSLGGLDDIGLVLINKPSAIALDHKKSGLAAENIINLNDEQIQLPEFLIDELEANRLRQLFEYFEKDHLEY